MGIWILEEEKKIQRRSLELRAENTPDSDGEAGEHHCRKEATLRKLREVEPAQDKRGLHRCV